MKKIRIFGFPSHQAKERTSGVDMVRIWQPLEHLAKHPDFEVTLFDIKKKTDWLWVAKNIDIIFFNYLQDPWGFAAMGAMARKHGVKMVMDLDDALWEIRSDNPASNVFFKGSEALQNFESICNEVDYMTVTNSYLRNVVMQHTEKKGDKIAVFPNRINLDLYTHRAEFKNNEKINLMHFGSTTHFIDLKSPEFVKGVNKIMKEYPNVYFKTVGAFIPEFRQRWGMRYENVFGHTDIYHWVKDKDKFPHFMDLADILVVPLSDTIYNRSKSNIKWLEAGSAKIPGVFQKIRQYTEVIDGSNGLTAEKSNEWYNAIKFLIDNPDKRKEMGEKAFKDISENWQMKDNVGEYADFFKSILLS